jgi:hypothetical protein
LLEALIGVGKLPGFGERNVRHSIADAPGFLAESTTDSLDEAVALFPVNTY